MIMEQKNILQIVIETSFFSFFTVKLIEIFICYYICFFRGECACRTCGVTYTTTGVGNDDYRDGYCNSCPDLIVTCVRDQIRRGFSLGIFRNNHLPGTNAGTTDVSL